MWMWSCRQLQDALFCVGRKLRSKGPALPTGECDRSKMSDSSRRGWQVGGFWEGEKWSGQNGRALEFSRLAFSLTYPPAYLKPLVEFRPRVRCHIRVQP